MKSLVLAGFALVLAHLAIVPATAANRVVTIVNKTGYALVELYGSNSGTNSWEEDILGDRVLPHGRSADVDFDDGTGHCVFDLLAVFEDGDRVTQEHLDVCKVGTFTFE